MYKITVYLKTVLLHVGWNLTSLYFSFPPPLLCTAVIFIFMYAYIFLL